MTIHKPITCIYTSVLLSLLFMASCSTSRKVAKTEEQFSATESAFRDSVSSSSLLDHTSNSNMTIVIEREYMPPTAGSMPIYHENPSNTPLIAATDASNPTDVQFREQEKQNLQPFLGQNRPDHGEMPESGSVFYHQNPNFGPIKERITISYSQQDGTHAEKASSFASQSTNTTDMGSYSTATEETQQNAINGASTLANKTSTLSRFLALLSSSWQILLIVALFLLFYHYILPPIRKAYKILHVLFGR